MQFILNSDKIETDSSKGSVLLNEIREEHHLHATKEGCREGECGACTVLIGEREGEAVIYRAVASCLFPLGDAAERHVVTLEGLNLKNGLTAVQSAFVENGATQCGFCTPGFVMSLTGYFLSAEKITLDGALTSIDGNICRCTGYTSIFNAVKSLVNQFAEKAGSLENRISNLIRLGFLPEYFLKIPSRLSHFSADQNLSGTVVSGGTDLFVQRPFELKESKNLHFLSRQSEMKEIFEKDGRIFVGAAASIEDMKRSSLLQKHFPKMGDSFNRISSTILRNRATAGGNFVNASPIGDLSVYFLPLSPVLNLSSGRSVKLNDFYLGYKQPDLKNGELILSFEFDVPKGLHHFEKVSRRTYLDIASVNGAAYFETDGEKILTAQLSCGGVAAFPLVLKSTGEFLEGKDISSKSAREAAEMAVSEVKPISDIRGEADYKSDLTRRIVLSHFLDLFPQYVSYSEVAL